ncbi:MAG: AzlD domain-containing protein [Propionibacteriales bacterium]|nr:AzlD domain-containing protein [Propionibacteriales bacterium]
MTWIAIVACGLACYLLKLAGLSVPERVLEQPLVQRVGDLLPVVLLTALIAVQVFSNAEGAHPTLTLDARVAGLGAAAVALVLRAPFLVVVLVAAATAALVRLL